MPLTDIPTPLFDEPDFVSRTWHHAASRPSATALRYAGESWTYEDVAKSASLCGRRLLAAGVSPGDRVLVAAPTSIGFVQMYLGILAIGAVAVPVNPMCTAREMTYFIDDSGARVIVGWHEGTVADAALADTLGLAFIELRDIAPGGDDTVLDIVSRTGDAPAVLVYTSGTTGRPKGAVLTLDGFRASAGSLRAAFDLTPDDRLGTALPLFHVYGQVAVLANALGVGATACLLRPFSGEAALRMVEGEKLTVMCGVPTMWIEMTEAARHLDPLPTITSLRYAASGGAALPVEANRAFREIYSAEVLDGYGLSETTCIATSCRPGTDIREGSAGQAMPGVTIDILGFDGRILPPGEVGEIAVSGRNLMAGYWQRPEATHETIVDGRLMTGDLGRLDEDGFLWVVGRTKEMIIRGGYNIYPREIEEVLYEHPAVMEAAVLGLPDDRLGEEVAAVVAVRAGHTLIPAELRSWLDERVAAYKVPRVIQIVDTLPKGATGKIQKIAIDREALARTGVRTRRSTS